ncbi:uncharacterized protein LOC135471105 [Liolophura sinensis]|uniref:uncharacterized protein LOC135471105 n=1 Tax=Liolophura sinensis TaxID=3198878 RepID=UPI003158C6EB
MKLLGGCLGRSTTFAFLLAVFRQVLSKDCPPDATQRAMLCVASIGGTSSVERKNNLLSDWDLNKITQACNNGTFSRGIECAEKIIKSCDDEPEQRENLKKYLNIPRMKKGMDRVCTITVRELANDEECIRRQSPFVTECADAEATEFKLKIHKMGEDMDKILKAACQVLQQVSNCQVDSVRRNCGARPADELTKVISYFDPDYCGFHQGGDPGSGGDSMTGRWLVTLVPCIVLWVYHLVSRRQVFV